MTTGQSKLSAEIIAHRGASFDAPENTLAAINLGWQQGADAVEIDVHFSKDGKIVAIHDDNTRRTARHDRKICEQTLAELQALDVGQWKAGRWAKECVPTLEQVLATIPPGKRLFVEIKCGPESLPEFTKALERSGKAPAQIVPISFSRETMRQLKQASRELEVCWVAEFKRGWPIGRWEPAAEKLIEMAKEAGLDGLDLSGKGPVDSEFVRKVKDAGLSLYIWTVDSPVLAHRLITAGVDGITTNRPGWLRQQLQDFKT